MKITRPRNLLLLAALLSVTGCFPSCSYYNTIFGTSGTNGSAVVTGPETGKIDSEITLDGSLSKSVRILEWSIAAPKGSNVTKCNVGADDINSTRYCTFTPDISGEYDIQLTALAGGSGKDSVENHKIQIVANVATRVSIDSTSEKIKADAPRTLMLKGLAHDPDDELIMEWSVQDNNCAEQPSFSDPASLSTELTVGRQVAGLDCSFSAQLTASPVIGYVAADRILITVKAPLVTFVTGVTGAAGGN
ncbi:hypothetical protein Ping_3401 [Psychromonas ingrahamii 37]|uniref:Uncharacterized protein n=1 Tax=Psychromonas ingrahamii (strain DSM 17664 / CCUG 51855 / 37) TaxID=357804 RepID=A1T020_PSYIN|nr:hypothetical protein [Psychromonas ingrahamii]ABM05085.1 hypothetical protein Ping_3401 [Psychromonas ingrahamii 37]